VSSFINLPLAFTFYSELVRRLVRIKTELEAQMHADDPPSE
jgi:hypothetical protein